MPDIDLSKIKPGDTVRVHIQSHEMRRQGIEPAEITSKVYRLGGSLRVVAYAVTDSPQVTILEHIPARPEWADALVVRAGELVLARVEDRFYVLRDGTKQEFLPRQFLADHVDTITVVLDADGNPPTPEWLDADALDKLPADAVILAAWARALPRWKGRDGWWRLVGESDDEARGYPSSDFDKARVLWSPEA